MYPPHAPMLPPELVDLVISNLCGDLVTLRTCGLVSRDWLATSRHHLYDATYLPRHNLPAFLDLLNSPYNTFFFRLRGLHAIGFPYTDTIQLYPVLPTFSYLRELHIYGKNLMFHNDALNPPLLPYLEFLSLTTAIFPSYPKLTAFLSQFPALRDLRLVNVACHADAGHNQQGILKLDLATLFITLGSGIMGWLKSSDFSLHAPRLETDIRNLEPLFEEYLKSVSSNLRELTLKFHTESQLSIFSEKPVLHSNAVLRSLKITHAFWISGDSYIRVSPGLGRILKKLMHSHLDQLVFVAAVEVGGFAPSPSSHDAIELLDGVGFAGLARIEFYGPWDSVEDILGKQFKSTISALLPCQTARGIVHVGGHKFN
ncbi:hypothetical protein C8R44DRAFT_869123 [Mycena epipterygia]|nr:hypothetical protein C8R44DRAFT_869123 [Mycena epipterygia]